MRKARLTIGIVLLVVLIAPVIVLCIPATGTQMVITQGGVELVEYTYIPLVELVRNPGTVSHVDIVFLVVYFGLYVLAIWLIRHKARIKEVDTK